MSYPAIIERGVDVRLMFSLWNHTKPDMVHYMKSLSALNGMLVGSKTLMVEVKLFQVHKYINCKVADKMFLMLLSSGALIYS